MTKTAGDNNQGRTICDHEGGVSVAERMEVYIREVMLTDK